MIRQKFQKNAKIIGLLFAILILSFLTSIFFRNIRIIQDVKNSTIETMQGGDGQLINLNPAEEEAIINFLHNCTEQRTLSFARSFSNDDVMFNIVIYADGNLKQIVLGKKSSFSSHGNSSFLYKIIDPKEVMEGIERIMNN